MKLYPQSTLARASEIFGRRVTAGEIVCTCGDPNHTPSCQVCLEWDNCAEDADQQLFEETTA